MATRKQVEVETEDQNPEKWQVSLGEEVFKRLLSSQGGSSSTVLYKVFGEGSLFSPLLFGKFFDPSDAFPLWDFESDILLSGLRSSGRCTVDWVQTDQDYVLKADIPGGGKNTSVRVCVENGKVVEISGEMKQQREGNKTKDWRSGVWWEHGFVRRLELPEDADWKKIEAYLNNDTVLEIKIPKNIDVNQSVEKMVKIKDSSEGV